MSKDKYVIANCPCIVINECNSFRNDEVFCKDCTDCVFKQIVEYCLDQNLKYDTTACDILDIMDIREADNDA